MKLAEKNVHGPGKCSFDFVLVSDDEFRPCGEDVPCTESLQLIIHEGTGYLLQNTPKNKP